VGVLEAVPRRSEFVGVLSPQDLGHRFNWRGGFFFVTSDGHSPTS
jgi:hypothetical protein